MEPTELDSTPDLSPTTSRSKKPRLGKSPGSRLSSFPTTNHNNNHDIDNDISATTSLESEKIALLGTDVEPETTCEKLTSCRWTLAYLTFSMVAMLHCTRTCISMAIICIADHSARNDSDGSSGGNGSEMLYPTGPEYIPVEKRGLVLAGYYYGSVVTPFMSGLFVERLGPKRIMTISLVMTAALTLVTPLAIRTSVALTFVVRILLGIASGPYIPCVTAIWSHWAPVEEKAIFLSITFSGTSLGNIISNFGSAFLCNAPVDEGWPFIFYTFGTMAAVWVLAWQWLMSNSPERHPTIRTKELTFIQQRRPSVSYSKDKKPSIQRPWRAIFTSAPFLALLVTHVSFIWITNLYTVFLPIYLNEQLLFTTEQTGLLTSLSFVFRFAACGVFGVLVVRLQKASLVSVSTNRKIFQGIGLMVPGVLLCGLGYLTSDQRNVSMILVVLGVVFQSACMSAFRLNFDDLSPRFSGTLAGITQTFSNLTQTVCPLVFSAIVQDGLQSSWITMLSLSGGIAIFGAVVFAAFGKADQQHWSSYTVEPPKADKK